jgi:antitoxin component HigA of HigAB toxin-antitoxin module
MVIFSKSTINDFGHDHADALNPLLEWFSKMIKSITTHDQFIDAMNIIDKYSEKMTAHGSFKALSSFENAEYGRLAILIEAYEDSIPVFPPEPNQSPEKTILIYMMHKRLKIAETALRLGVSDATMAEILAGKYPIDNHLSQKLYDVLGVKSEYLLQAA